jgi:hypothetical protein
LTWARNEAVWKDRNTWDGRNYQVRGLLGSRAKTEFWQNVVVTGASAGVGRATVRAFAREGAQVGLIARDTEGRHVAAREVDELGGKGMAAPADVADANQVEAAAARIEGELGPIAVWINNAMTTIFGLGRTGFDSQQTKEEVSKNRPDNLFGPLPGDFGAHGVFGQQAHEKAATRWVAEHKGITALVGAATLGALALVISK